MSEEWKAVYDEDSTMSYGFWTCPECGSSFYAGGGAIHCEGCSLRSDEPFGGYRGCVYHFGPKEAEAVKAAGKAPPLSPSFLTPEVVEAAMP